jgi:hypothetical protein
VQGFFELRSRGPGRHRPPDRRPTWLGPPEDSFGVLVPLHLVLVRTADLAVAIPSANAYGNGFGFDLAIRRAAAEDDAFALDRTLHWLGREGSPPPEVLRVGVQFADGQKATSLDSWWDYLDPQSWTQAPAIWAGAAAVWRRGWRARPQPVLLGVAAAACWAAGLRCRVARAGRAADAGTRGRGADPAGRRPGRAAVAQRTLTTPDQVAVAGQEGGAPLPPPCVATRSG